MNKKLNKEELKNEIYKLKRYALANPFIMHSEKEAVSLNAVIDIVDRLEEPEITREQAYSKIAETLPISTSDLQSKVEGLVLGRNPLNDTELEVEPETVATVIYDYMKAAKRFEEVLGMGIKEVEK